MTPPPRDPVVRPEPVPESPTVERTSVLAEHPETPRAAVEQRWQAFARLMTVGAPGLAPLVRVAPLADGVALTHRLPAGAVPLGDLRKLGPLRAGHVVTVALAVVEALVALADQDLAHGAVGADQVVVGPAGEVVLAGCGLAWRRAPSDVDGPRVADDVAALGELVRDLLGTGSSPSSLVLAALRAADPDPALRPTPHELLALLSPCRADPLLDLLWGGLREAAAPGTVRLEAATVALEPVTVGPPTPSGPSRREAAASRLRIDPRVAPEPEEPVDDRTGPAGAAGPARAASSRRADVPPRPAARERRRPRGRAWRGPLVLVVVSVLALLTLGAVRVGAGARAEGPSVAAPSSSPSTTVSTPTTESPSPSGSVSPPAAEPSASVPAVGLPVGPGAAGLVLDRASQGGADDWVALLGAADAGRQRALAAGDATALEDWVDPDGSAWPADAALAARVSALGAQIEGGDLVVLQVRPERIASDRAVLVVQDRREAYSVVTAEGRSEVPVRAARWWRVTLGRTPDPAAGVGWRIRDVAPVPAPAR